MATFSGGEEIVGIASVTGAGNSVTLVNPIVNYTIPAGQYGRAYFDFDASASTNVNFAIYNFSTTRVRVINDGNDLEGAVFLAGDNIRTCNATVSVFANHYLRVLLFNNP